MRRWGICVAIGAMAIGAVGSVQAQAPPSAAPSGRPDVLVLVYQQPGQADLVDVTYAQAVPHAQAQRDLGALAQATGWAMGPSRITDGLAPVEQKMVMTSSSFTAPGVIPNGTGVLPVAPFVTAFRSYKRLALIFSIAPGFQFQGPSDYVNNDVQIALQQRGTAYTYQVRIVNPQFTRLNLPRPLGAESAAPRRAAPWVLFLGILATAGAAGVLVYVLMARKTPSAPPPANTDAPAEERTKIGTRG